MSINATKVFASIIVSVMSFLGWDTSEYNNYLPKSIKEQVVLVSSIEEASSTPKLIQPSKQDDLKSKNAASTRPGEQKEVPSTELKKPASVLDTSQNTTAPKAAKQVSQNLSQEERIKRSTINILCSMQRGKLVAKFTGSGVVVDPSGVILTNAHVAEHVMLAEAGYETCSIRIGSPAKNAYKAKIIYIPDAWISSNKNNIFSSTVTGNGANDYALLIITELTARDAPNVPLPYLPPSENTVSVGNQITLAGYPSSFGNSQLLDSALYFLQKSSQVVRTSGFNGIDADVINTSPTSLAEHGSSGGAIVGSDGSLVGIIDSTVVDNLGQKSIQGISISYIKKSIQNTLGKSINSLMENAKSEAASFEQNKLKSLSSMLIQ